MIILKLENLQAQAHIHNPRTEMQVEIWSNLNPNWSLISPLYLTSSLPFPIKKVIPISWFVFIHIKCLIKVTNIINYLLLGFSLVIIAKGPSLFTLVKTRGKCVLFCFSFGYEGFVVSLGKCLFSICVFIPQYAFYCNWSENVEFGDNAMARLNTESWVQILFHYK